MTNGDDSASGFAGWSPRGILTSQAGLTKREYFAAMAMQGLTVTLEDTYEGDGTEAALVAVALADALIEALNK